MLRSRSCSTFKLTDIKMRRSQSSGSLECLHRKSYPTWTNYRLLRR
uniref:Uncharacterized protein n=1 Tax=Arundo donax TaxID=35708 RepID=A0A0A8Y6U8_ARUDO